MSKLGIIGIIAAVIVITGIVYSTVNKNIEIQKIKANPKQGTAKITERDIPTKSSDDAYGVWLTYEYDVDGKHFRRTKKYYFKKNIDDYLVGYNLPFIYCQDNPEYSCLLILESEYQEFGLPQPDSLKKYNKRMI